MSFKTELAKSNSENCVNQEIKRQGKKGVSSFNQLTINYLNKNEFYPEFVIVGTLTPQRNKGFFYTASNTQFDIIDCIKGSKLTDISKNNAYPANRLLEELKDNKLAVLDVIKRAVDNSKSNSDNDIETFCLDYDAFKNCHLKKSIFICNSKNSEAALKKIMKANGMSNVIRYAPQYMYKRNSNEIKKNMPLQEAKIDRWRKAFDQE